MTVSPGRQAPRGRAGDLTLLEQALHDARSAPVVVTVTGEAGIGKTTLLEAFAQRAREQGATVLLGGCTIVAGEPIQYAAIAQALRGSQYPGEGAPSNRSEYFERVLAMVVAQRRAEQVLLLMLEDVHWADAGTLELVAFLSRNLPAGHLIVLSYRDDQELLDPGARFVLAGMTSDSHLRRIELARLDAQETAQLARSIRGSALSAAEAGALYRRCSGNPFIATELVNAEIAGRVPTRLQDVLLVRTRQLGPDAMSIVQALALLGRPAGHALLRDALGLPPAALRAALEDCIGQGVVIVDRASSSYRFRHNLTQEAVIGTMLPGLQEDLHYDLARTLAELTDIDTSPSAAAEWASHLHASGRIQESARAALRAAAVTRRAFAYGESWRQLRRVVDYWRAGATPDSLGIEDLAGLLEEASEAARWAGDSEAAATLARDALGRHTTDAGRARVGERLGRSLWDLGRPSEAEAAFEQSALDAQASGDLELIATVTASSARLSMLRGDYPRAIERSTAAVELATQANVESERGRALTTLGTALLLRGDQSAGLEPLRDAVRIAREHGDLEDLRRATGNLAYSLMLTGRTDEAAEVAIEGLARARRYNLIAATGAALVTNTIVILGLCGRLDEAEGLYDDAVGEGITNAQALLIHLAGAELDLFRGRVGPARSKVDQAMELHERAASAQISADLLIGDAAVRLAEGRAEETGVLIRRALELTADTEEYREALRACEIGLRALAAPAGQPGRPRRVDEEQVSWLLAAAEGAHRRANNKEHTGYWLTCRAEAARARREDAAQAWQEAAQWWQDCRRPIDHGWALLRLAKAMMTHDRSAAIDALTKSRAIAERLALAPLIHETERLTRHARINPKTRQGLSQPGPTAVDPAGLTDREREVLELLASGKTNKDIATDLFLSPRTVGVHVSNVLRKLDASTRGQAVAIARERRLVQDAPDDGA